MKKRFIFLILLVMVCIVLLSVDQHYKDKASYKLCNNLGFEGISSSYIVTDTCVTEITYSYDRSTGQEEKRYCYMPMDKNKTRSEWCY